MASSQVRRFNFFDKEAVKDTASGQPMLLFQANQVNCATSGRNFLIFGDVEGYVYLYDRSFQLTSFRAFEFSISYLHQLQHHSILLGVGSDEEGVIPTVKIWNMDKVDRDGSPQCARTMKIVHGKPVPITCVTAHEDLTLLAVGMATGEVYIYRGDILKDRLTNRFIRIPAESAVVTGLAFLQESRDIVLFVATGGHVSSYSMAREQKLVLDDKGCNLHCTAMGEMEGEPCFYIAREEGLWAYQAESRGGAIGFDGNKSLITSFRNYVVIVTTESRRAEASAGKAISTVTVYDTRNKFVAFTAGFENVYSVLSEWGSLFVVCADGKVFQLVEKDYQSKLDMLFKKHLYDIAINVARSQAGSDTDNNESLVEIYTQYANHLYSKGNFDAAIQQYIKTIGQLEPSHVIRKFLDSQRIYNLTDYLQALHEKTLADKHHTTLLLNCYTKLKRKDKLDEFVMSDRQLNFDCETAITVCRHAGYFEHALYLAKKFNEHDWYLKIQLEDVKNYADALEYISKLSFEDAERSLKMYGKELVTQLPKEATELLTRLCTPDPERSGTCAHPEEFIHIFVNQLEYLIKFLEHVIKVRGSSDLSSQVYDTLLELYLRPDTTSKNDDASRQQREVWVLELLKHPDSKYDDYHAMVLAQIYDFTPGILYLYEKARQYQQIVQYYMEHEAYAEIIDTCKKYGSVERTLWVQALAYFASKQDCKAQIAEILQHIDRNNLLPPLMVVDALSHNSTASLLVIKDYLIKRLDIENKTIAEDERMIRQYRDETEEMRREISELKTKAKIFQDMRCTNCKSALDLPAVHFLCGHSYHQRCLVGESEECTACAEQRHKVLSMYLAQAQTAEQHDQFYKQLDGAESRFSVVAEYFGRGVFNKSIALPTDALARSTSRKRESGAGALSRGGLSSPGEEIPIVQLTGRLGTMEDRRRPY